MNRTVNQTVPKFIEICQQVWKIKDKDGKIHDVSAWWELGTHKDILARIWNCVRQFRRNVHLLRHFALKLCKPEIRLCFQPCYRFGAEQMDGPKYIRVKT
jgi:hypothetical protein